MNKTKLGINLISVVRESSSSISNAIDFILFQADNIITEAENTRNSHLKKAILRKQNEDGINSYNYILTYLINDVVDKDLKRSGGTIHGELIPLSRKELDILTHLLDITTNQGIFLLLTYLYKIGFFEDNPDYMNEVGDILIKYAQQFQNVIRAEIEEIKKRYERIVHPRILLTNDTHVKDGAEINDSKLLSHLQEIVHICKLGSILGESDYISQFYAFLIEKQYFTPEEIGDFLETGDDTQNLYSVIDNILVRNFLGDLPNELSELLNTYLLILSKIGETERYKRLVDFFQNNDK